ncbi:MAG: family 78 glycoside hydrolase catalytic domain [Alistipes sp.]|nr:family 78 glycoside hydrolase catalytic domain [Alistipes sp.]
MKRLLPLFLLFVASSHNADLEQCDKFEKAVAVWSEGREKEQNLTLSFREVVEVKGVERAYVRLTASCDYRMRINGEFVAHGPSVAAHDFYRVDCYDVTNYLREGRNIVAIEVAGYNTPSYYLLDQPSFLQAEVEVDGRVVAATGKEFRAYDLAQRVADVPKFSFQRPHTEQYNLKADFSEWTTNPDWQSVAPEKLVEQPHKELLVRGVAYPDYTTHNAQLIDGKTLYKFATNSTGFLCAKVRVLKPTQLTLRFDEILGEDGRVMKRRLSWKPYIIYNLQEGEYELESFEPYTMQYVEVFAEAEACEVESIYMRDYCNSDCHRATFEASREELNELFEASRRNYRQNVLDVYMDCPGRERTGWLGDSYFTSRAEFNFSGKSKVEHNFLENFLLPEKFRDIADGMLPMCYPADHRDGNFIPNFAMWFVLELEEYRQRTGDVATVERARKRVYDLLDYYKPFLNEDGLLENLERWVFVDYSHSNKCTQGVSYPSNMLYAKMLDTVARIYGDQSLAEQAEQIRKTILRQSFNGEFFVDNAVRNEEGRLVLTENITEACQYYALFCEVVTPKSHPDFWLRMREGFSPQKREAGSYAHIPPANVFIGNYLRFEMLSREGYCSQLVEEVTALYMPMVRITGTLWEFFKPRASCCHGFGSHIAHILYRDLLGVYQILPCERKVRVRMVDCGLEWCRGSIPVGDEQIDIEWHYTDGEFKVKMALPQGYTCEVVPTDYKVTLVE